METKMNYDKAIAALIEATEKAKSERNLRLVRVCGSIESELAQYDYFSKSGTDTSKFRYPTFQDWAAAMLEDEPGENLVFAINLALENLK